MAWGTSAGEHFLASNPASAIAASTAIPTAGTTLTGGALGGKLSDWGGGFYNLKSPANPSGAAVGDFVALDTASVAAAIAAAQAVNGLVWIPDGIFAVDAQLLPNSRVTMMGPGTLKLKNGATVGAMINFFNGASAGDRSQFLYFTLDGNQAGGGSGIGLNIGAPSDCLVYGMTVQNMNGHSIRNSVGDRTRIESNVVTGYLGYGIVVDGPSRVRVRGNTVKSDAHGGAGPFSAAIIFGATTPTPDGIVEANLVGPGTKGIAIQFNTGCANGLAANNRVIAYDDAIDFNSATGCMAIGNQITADSPNDGAGTGIFLNGNACAAIGNRISGLPTTGIVTGGTGAWQSLQIIGNWVQGLAAGNGIYLGSGNANLVHWGTICQGNVVKDGTGTTVGIKLDVGLDMCICTDNVSLNNAGGNFVDLATGANIAVRNNIGINPKGNLAAPGIPTSAAVFGNPKHFDCMVYIAGGTLTAIGLGGCPLPVNAAFASAGTGGTLANNTAFFYRVSALNAAGETLASTETSTTTPAGANTCTVTVKWGSVAGATGYNVYGRTTGAELKIGSNVQALSFVDDGSVTPSGALPGADTTANTAVGITAAAAAGSVHTLRVPAMSSIKLTYSVAPTWTWFGD